MNAGRDLCAWAGEVPSDMASALDVIAQAHGIQKYVCLRWAGEVPSVWRYYEGVPDDMASALDVIAQAHGIHPKTLKYVCLCWAGEVPSVWRYYEGVPDDMASLRTPEAAVIADRHLWCAPRAIAAPDARFLDMSRDVRQHR